MLPSGRSGCVPFDQGPALLDRVRHAARSLLFGTLSATDSAGGAVTVDIPSKQVAADPAHSRPSQSARKSPQRQDRFISDIAHDLRTPLGAICEFASLMDAGIAGPVTEQQQQYLGIIERRCREAARMLDDLLDGARLQSGRIHPHREAVDFAAVLGDVRESLDPAFRHARVSLAVELPENLPRLFGDRDMLGRILTNLVSNGIKFSPPGGTIVIRAERHSVSTARISVIDCGSGISPEDMRRIFRRFEQGANRVRSGVGLGLSIVRQLVKLHGGRVTAESTPGKGSRFHFTLPLFLPTAIVRRHLAATIDGRQPTSWSVHCPEPTKYAAIHRLITATVRARDLVLPDDERRRILLITASENPNRLTDRLQRQIASHGVATPLICPLTAEELKRLLDGIRVPPATLTPVGPAQLAG
jgi:signal transduction histidine kinase